MTTIEMSYQEVEKLIYYTCHQFRLRHGGDIDDLISIANSAFIKAYETFDEGRSSFSSWVRMYVWNVMLEDLRKRIKKKEVTRDFTEDQIPTTPFNPDPIYDRLSKDGKLLLSLVLDTPPGLARTFTTETPVDIRKNIRSYLRGMGWSATQIAMSFNEVRRAL